ncbi:unnamed protein product [Lactuca virosa]|uniref:Glycosyl transferase 48 domain-containing protein n=1 Tax=Lactuca virosa TaxID=75947 RepID=A0AAU9NVM2_9ASTR|nr:unnamed protein product [Lactuca virosa]
MKLEKIPILPLQESGSTSTINSTEGQNLELLNELKIAKAESESLVRKMEQMECYYEALVQDLEENQKNILREFQSLKNEHSTCACSINDQMLRFDEERRELSSINKELQKRATTSESALKRARLNYSIAVSQLQKDLDMLSFQVLSMFETNQTVIKEAFSYSSQGHEDLVDDDHRSKNLSGGGDVLSGDLKKYLSLQENIYKKVEEDLGEMCSTNLYLDMYSGALSGTLMEAVSDDRTSCWIYVASGCHIYRILVSLADSLVDKGKDILLIPEQTQVVDSAIVNRCGSDCLILRSVGYGYTKGGSVSYVLLTLSSCFLVVSWLFVPYIFYPSGFEWQKVMEDFDDWTNWLMYKGGVGVKGDNSWESWWDEEQAHIHTIKGRVLETILCLRSQELSERGFISLKEL